MKTLTAAICIVLALSPLLIFVSCESANAETVNCKYDLSVVLDETENKVSVDEKVTVTNTFADSLSQLVFAFYPDAFTLKNPPPVDEIMISAAYPYGINAGGYAFLQAGGENVESVSVCETPCKIVVRLASPLSLGESTDVLFSFDLTLPLCNTRYGYNDFSVNLTYFFPQLCRFDETTSSFLFYEYYATGDPFAFDTADYSLSLKCPDGWQVACSAKQISRKNGKGKYEASSLRDLSLIIAPEAETDSATEGDYTATVMHDGNYAYSATYAAKALALFSQAFGDLPSKHYYLVFTPFMTAGAEFSNVALISSSLSFSEAEKVVAHEVSHQWWYSLVGSDQVSAPWQDEALAQWSTLFYFEKTGMKSYAETLKSNMSAAYADYVASQRALGEDALLNVFRKTSDYRDNTDYYVTVYCKAALAICLSADSITTERFVQALSDYVNAHRDSFADYHALFTTLDRYDGAGKLLSSSLSASLY